MISQCRSPIPVEGDGKVETPFNFAEKLSEIQSSQEAKQTSHEEQEENVDKENEQTKEEEDAQTKKIEEEKQNENATTDVVAGKEKKQRRVVTFFQTVNKPSSPIRDSGQLSMEDDEGCHDDDAEGGGQEKSSVDKESGDGKLNESGEVSELSVVLIEDTCQDVTAEEPLIESALVSDETKDEEEKASEICVPDTQEDPKEPYVVHDVSDEVQNSITESRVKDEDSGEPVTESPVRVENMDLEDVLPDGRFRKVVSTPVIKLQKLTAKDLELYSPRKYQEDSEVNTGEDQGETQVEDQEDSTLERSPDPVPSPAESTPSGTPRFRRYRSDEIHVRSATPKRTRRWNSVSEITKSESKISPQKSSSQSTSARKSIELSSLQSSQRDLAELAERYDLDGIAPLEDLDQSIEEVQANPDKTNNDSCDKELTSDPEFIPQLKQSNEIGKSDENRTDYSILSDQDIFSQMESESQVVEESFLESSEHAPESESSKTLSQNETRRKRGRPRKNQEVTGESQDKSQSKDATISESGTKEANGEVATKRKRGRPRKSEAKTDRITESPKQDHSENDKSVNEFSEGSQGKEALSDMMQNKENVENSQESMCMDTSDKVFSNEIACEQPKEVGPSNDMVRDGNSSSEDLFGTCTMTSSSQVHHSHLEGANLNVKSKFEDSFCSEDDDIPLGQLKKSLEASSKMEAEKESESFLPLPDSEDSEIDFPSLKPGSVLKVSPDIETPPKESLAKKLPSVIGSPTACDSSTEKTDEETFTITRSGRKCKPSAKIRCAKDILRRALKSPEGKSWVDTKKSRANKSVEGDKISPKRTRSSALKKDKRGKKSPELEESDKPQTKDSISQPAAEETNEVSPIKSSRDDLSSYAISPQSLQVLAEMVAKEISPELVPKVRSAHKSIMVSPDASPVSSQALHGCRSGKISKRSKSPISLRLKARRLCITPGPLQTRAGTKLSRVEIKKKNKKRRQSNVAIEEDRTVGTDVEEKSDVHSEEAPEQTSDKATDVIVISDTMSQEDAQIPEELHVQDECKEVSHETSTSTQEDGEKEDLTDAANPGDILEEPSQNLDEDGDVQMREVEEVPSQCEESGEAKTDDCIEQLPQDVEKETVVDEQETAKDSEDKEDIAAETGDFADAVEEVVSPAKELVSQAKEVVSETAVTEDDAANKIEDCSEGVVETAKTEDSEMRIRSKRSSQRLEFGDDSTNTSETRDLGEEDSGNLEGCEKLQKATEEEGKDDDGNDDGSESDDDSSATESDTSDDQECDEEPPTSPSNIQSEGEKEDGEALDEDKELDEAVADSMPVGIVSSGLDIQGKSHTLQSYVCCENHSKRYL